MDNLKLYEVSTYYVDYLKAYAEHIFFDYKSNSVRKRKYVGVVLEINNFEYFAPLSSFKEKHKKMKNCIDFIKIKDYAVINLNNMFPVPPEERMYVDINCVRDIQYRSLLLAEYRYIKSIQEKIRKNARTIYNIKVGGNNKNPIAVRCNDFKLLEKACVSYIGY